jgi:hypothetical protein
MHTEFEFGNPKGERSIGRLAAGGRLDLEGK